MNIREAQDSDIPAIIALLKASLGDTMIPKSESLWRWKHLANPFGPSPTLLAEEEGKLIGLRAFLRWEFFANGKKIFACRAVDTATHPDFQGKGIFKTLTKQLVDQVRSEGTELIFNTPNKKSTPGYLNMGWEKRGKLPLKLQFHLSSGTSTHPLQPKPWSQIENLILRLEAESLHTPTSQHIHAAYLKWRYLDCPLFPYHFLSDQESFLLFYRIKEGKLGRELRICDLFTQNDFGESQKKNAPRTSS